MESKTVGKGMEGKGGSAECEKQWELATVDGEEQLLSARPPPWQLISSAPRLRRDELHPAAATPVTSSSFAARTSKQPQPT